MTEPRGQANLGRVCRLFPLPNVVLFPHAVLPLHIFEPRYRQLTEDALTEGDRLITMVQTHEAAPEQAPGVPALETIGCQGRIFQHHRLSDGRYNILLVGLNRVRLTRELSSNKLYRLAEAEIIPDQVGSENETDPRRNELQDRLRKVVARIHHDNEELRALVDTSLPLGPLTDLIAFSLGFPAELKQGLLDEPRAEHRADVLFNLLGQLLETVPEIGQDRPPFPPRFSLN